MKKQAAHIQATFRAHKSDLIALGALLLVVIICSETFIHSSGWSRFWWSLFGYGGLLCVYKIARLSFDSIGLAPATIKSGLKYGGYVVGLIFVVFLLTFLLYDQAFQDPRYDNDIPTALFMAFVLLPLKTVLFEELTFRGLLPALLLRVKHSRWFASVVSSVLFGFWHVGSAGAIGNYSLTDSVAIPSPLVIAGIVLVTTCVGIVLCELRWRSRSLVAPIIVHWFINGFAILLASLSWR